MSKSSARNAAGVDQKQSEANKPRKDQNLMKQNPSDFTNYPWNSVSKKSETETVAQNIMIVLKRTGNTFRPLSRDEYARERQKDGSYSEIELQYFDAVCGYCESAEKAAMFSPDWK